MSVVTTDQDSEKPLFQVSVYYVIDENIPTTGFVRKGSAPERLVISTDHPNEVVASL